MRSKTRCWGCIMDILMHGKTAIITSASTGIGYDIAESLVRSGCRVVLSDSSPYKLNAIVNRLGNAIAVHMDASDKESVANAVSILERAGERIDICINNGGYAITTRIFEEDKSKNFESIIKTNIIGVWYVTKEIAKHMKNHSIHGSIVNITGIGSQNDSSAFCGAPYLAAKAAMVKLTKDLVKELSVENIRINCIIPRADHHSLVEDELNNTKYKNKINTITPFGFVVETLEELNGLLLWLSSNIHSSYITGACITVNGSISWGEE